MSVQTGLQRIVGSFEWRAPPWTQHRWVKPVVWMLALVILALVFWRVLIGWLPQEPSWTVEAHPPGLASYEPDNRWFREVQPDSLHVVFDYRAKDGEVAPTAGPARVDLVGRVLESGIQLRPAIAGQWRWMDDTTLEFSPEADWPAGQTFNVDIGSEVLGPEIQLAQATVSFETPPLTIEIREVTLSDVAGDGPARSVSSVVQSSHALNPESLRSAVSIRAGSQSASVTVEMDQWGRRATLTSTPLRIGEESLPVRVSIAGGVAPAEGPSRTEELVVGETILPDRASAFTVVALQAQALAQPDSAPQQILAFEFSSRVRDEALASGVRLLQLPPRKRTLPDGREVEERWRGVGTIPAEVVAQARAVPVTVIPGPVNERRTIALAFEAPQGTELVVVLRESFTDVDGLPLTRGHVQVVDSPSMPRSVSVVGSGGVLLRSGQRRLSIASQGVAFARAEISRVRPEAIMQLVSQTHGDIVNAEFSNWNFSADDLGERYEHTLRFSLPPDGSASYTTLDMAPWLGDGGVFVINLRGCEDEACERFVRAEGDRRLLVVTDFGLLAKVSPDRSRDVFVQSLSGGGPVADLEVLLLGRNGAPIQRARTDAQGRVQLGAHEEQRRERAPTVIVARRGNDIAFLPWDGRGRGLNTSRFPIGGDWRLPVAPDALRGELISQRPHYRPGDTVHIAAVLRRGDFAPLEALPLELEYSHQRQAVHTATLRASADGLLEHALPTTSGWARGRYSATLYLAGRTRGERTQLAQVEFDLDEITPARMRVRYAFAGDARTWRGLSDVQSVLELENLFGAAATDRRVEVRERVVARTGSVSIRGWDGWSFRNPFLDDDARDVYSNERSVTGRSGDDGRYTHEVNLAGLAEGIYEVILSATAFEAGDGAVVTASLATLVSSLDTLVGQRTSTNLQSLIPREPAHVEFIAVSQDGQAVELPGASLRVSRLDQVVSLVRAGAQYRYEPTERVRVLSEEAFALATAPTRRVLDTANPGQYRIELIDAEGRVRGRVAYVVAGDGSTAAALAREAQLTLSLARREYQPGDDIEMTLVAPYAGAGLITIESDRVLASRWFRANAGESRQTIRVPAGLEQGAYVTVTMVRAPDSPELFSKPLAYAITPFEISRSRRELAVTLEAPELARPGQPVTIRVSTLERARVLVFGVDEGILMQGNVAPPDPLARLIARPRLAVETLQTADLLLPEFELLQRLLAPGGDMEMAMSERAMAAPPPGMPDPRSNPFARVADEPAVFWAGTVQTGPRGTEVTFTPPESFNGEMRLVAIAVSESRLGATHKPLRIRAPFVLMPALLTHAAPGDAFRSTLLVANVGVDMDADTPVTVRVRDERGVIIEGERERTLMGLTQGREQRVEFAMRAGAMPGDAEVTYEVEQGDILVRRRVTISVRPPMPFRASMQGGVVPRDAFTITPSRTLLEAHAIQRLAVSASPLVLIGGIQEVLSRLPCACTDQIASSAFVNLAVHDPDQKVAEQIAELVRRQQGDGGFGVFQRVMGTDRYTSLHVLHLLLDASESGHRVPASTLDQGRRWLFAQANRGAEDMGSVRQRALAVYLLARTGEAVGAQASQLRDNLTRLAPDAWSRDIAATLLASTWEVLRNADEAERLASGYRLTGDMADDGLHVYLLGRHFPARAAQLDREAVARLIAPLTAGRYDHLSAARAAMGLAALATASGERTPATATLTMTDGSTEEVTLDSAIPLSASTHSIRLQGGSGLYWAVTQAGYDAEVPEAAQRNGLEVMRELLDEDGKAVTQFRQGDLVTVRITVRSTDGANHRLVAVTDLLPGGFDLQRGSLTGPVDASEPGEERVVLYTSVTPGVKEFRYQVRLTAVGSFIVPPIQAESMNQREVNGLGPASRVEVAAAR